MKLQVLVATLNNKNAEELYKKMNLTSDALIINQSNEVKYEKKCINNSLMECYTFNERGLSKSRNNALLRCNGDIICFADDDMVYSNNYNDDIIKEFNNHPEADAIVFNVNSNIVERSAKKILKFSKVGKMEFREYGSVHIAIRTKAIKKRNIYFNTLFGSGAKYKSGEDTIFLKELLNKNLKLYKSPIVIGSVDMNNSTWFNGYTENYFVDRGAIITCMYPKIKKILFFIQACRNSKKLLGSYKYFHKIYKWYNKGASEYKDFFER